MSGKETNRGILYQSFAAVLEALNESEKWDRIFVEYATEGDKVDIALTCQQKPVRCIQVKSSVNPFKPRELEKWLTDLINDQTDSPFYDLFLIGQCGDEANKFVKAIHAFPGGNLNEENKKALKRFDTGLLQNRGIRICILPFELSVLEAIVRDALHQYLSQREEYLTYPQLELLANATVEERLVSATGGDGTAREAFDRKLLQRLQQLKKSNMVQRTPVGIYSFPGQEEKAASDTQALQLTAMFVERWLRPGATWEDVYHALQEFCTRSFSRGNSYQLSLVAHTTIAFAAGRLLDSKATGLDVVPIQRLPGGGEVLWEPNLQTTERYPMFSVTEEIIDEAGRDCALVMNLTHMILPNVREYIGDPQNNLSVRKIFSCSLENDGKASDVVADGTHALMLAREVYPILHKRTQEERQGTLHLFVAAPNGFTFFLGKLSMGFGRCVLYEYDYEHRENGSYSPAMAFG